MCKQVDLCNNRTSLQHIAQISWQYLVANKNDVRSADLIVIKQLRTATQLQQWHLNCHWHSILQQWAAASSSRKQNCDKQDDCANELHVHEHDGLARAGGAPISSALWLHRERCQWLWNLKRCTASERERSWLQSDQLERFGGWVHLRGALYDRLLSDWNDVFDCARGRRWRRQHSPLSPIDSANEILATIWWWSTSDATID